jgi:hypothetical protein
MEKKQAQILIEDTFNESFNEDQFTVFARNLLNDFEPKSNTYSGNLLWDDYKEHINTYKRIGKYIDPEGEALDVLIVEVKSVAKLERARTALRNFVIKHLSKFEKDYALVAFYSREDEGADWRFSFIKLEYRSELDEEKGKVKTKKEFTPAKRYSFLVGKYEKAHTAKNQLLPLLQNISNNPTIEELEAAFSIEKVTDEFFNQYKDLYIKLFEHFNNDNKVKTELEKAGIDNARFTKKLLGQIVFLYFLQKKGWLGVPKNERWGTGKKRFVQELYDQSQNEGVNFFKDKLQYLFYEALAKERDNENSFYKRFDCRIPFLNGGLFEADYHWETANITIPETLFRNEEKNKSGDIGTGALDVFDRYNFTIKEDEPLDKEVAVDPEMLGKVFENMLDITERKSKGAFYTPREIVHYMCQESLIHYLDNSLNNGSSSFQELGSDQIKMFGGSSDNKGNLKIELEYNDNIRVPKKDIETYIREGHFALENDERVATKGETKTYKYQLPESIRLNADFIDQKLSDIRICDPAIGSGAFPVGLLHELVNAMLVLKPHFSDEYLSKKLKSFSIPFKESYSESRYIYRLKRHIIQESIYGVDIDASAIDIARLRLWLSLVVDEDDLDPIETLPNLDYKIVCGNSLIGMPETAMRDLNVEGELEILKDKFYNVTNETEKKALRLEINTKIKELLGSAEQFAGYKIDFDFKLFFSEVWREKGGFDVVIGNPPYTLEASKEDKKIFKDLYKLLHFKINLFACFIEKGVSLSKSNGTLTFIIPNLLFANDSLKNFRKFFLENCKINHLINLGDGVFDKAVVPTMIFSVNPNNKVINDYSYKLYPKVNSISDLKSTFFLAKKSETLSNFNHVFETAEPKIRKVIEKLTRNSEILENYLEVNQGIITGNDNELLSESAINTFFKPTIRGKDIDKYFIRYPELYVCYEPSKLACPRTIDLFEVDEKLLMRRTGDSPVLTYDNQRTYNLHTLYSCRNISKFNIKTLLALCNSSILKFVYQQKLGTELGRTFAEIKIVYLRQLPIKNQINDELSIVILVNYLLALNTKDNLIEKNFFDSVIDTIVFQLYFPEEIKSAGKEILKYLGDLKPITDDMSEEKKLAIIQSEFERLYDPNHPVRFAIETLDSVEEVRIIKEALK